MLQSKKVKLVATKSGPFSNLTDSLLVKWDSPLGIIGSRSFLTKMIGRDRMMMKMYLEVLMIMMKEMYLGVVQDTPVLVLVAFVISTCNQCGEGKEA